MNRLITQSAAQAPRDTSRGLPGVTAHRLVARSDAHPGIS